MCVLSITAVLPVDVCTAWKPCLFVTSVTECSQTAWQHTSEGVAALYRALTSTLSANRLRKFYAQGCAWPPLSS